MKQFFILSGLAVFLTFSHPAAADEMKAVLDHAVPMIGADGNKFNVGPGEISVNVQPKGWFFNSKMTVTFNNRTYTIKVPKDSYTSDTDANVGPDQSGQPFRLVGKMEAPRYIKSWRSVDSGSCTYQGLCMACSPGMDFQGKMVTDCSVKLNLLCPGQQDVQTANKLYESSYTLEFRDPGNPEKVIARASAPLKQDVATTREKVLSDCNMRISSLERDKIVHNTVGLQPDASVSAAQVVQSSPIRGKRAPSAAASSNADGSTSMDVSAN